MLKNYLLNRSSDRLARFARGLRDTYFRALSPIDRLGLVITDKGHYPPLLLRREVGDLAAFETSSAEFVAYLKLLCDLKPREHVLDIGCGCGQLALQLEAYLQDGRYTGFDVQSQAVSWCQRRISARSPHFSFFHFNAYNARYNRAGERNIE